MRRNSETGAAKIMQRRQFFSHALGWGVAGATACCVTGCGTLFHSERCGQPHSNRLDWPIVALDGLGLLLFFVPGVVAFVVDFCSGAIYLPLEPAYPVYEINPQQPPIGSRQDVSCPQPAVLQPASVHLAHEDSSWKSLGLKRIVIPREQLQQPRIEEIATHYVGEPVSLNDSLTRVSVLPCIERFNEQTNRHRSDRSFGFAVRSFFDRLKPKVA